MKVDWVPSSLNTGHGSSSYRISWSAEGAVLCWISHSSFWQRDTTSNSGWLIIIPDTATGQASDIPEDHHIRSRLISEVRYINIFLKIYLLFY